MLGSRYIARRIGNNFLRNLPSIASPKICSFSSSPKTPLEPKPASSQPSSQPQPSQPKTEPKPFWEFENWKAAKEANRRWLFYMSAFVVVGIGLSYASVPLYQMFCQATGFAGTPMIQEDEEKLRALGKLAPGREITVHFEADTHSRLPWEFRPSQTELVVRIGEPALAFYTATNKSDTAITGFALYNVLPDKVGKYFHKVKCFCFDEQKIRAHETVDLPVFFYFDPEMESDANMNNVNFVTLSYTFNRMYDEDEEEAMSEEERKQIERFLEEERRRHEEEQRKK